jgi:hypothetical protein
MLARLRYLLGWLMGVFRSRKDLILENLDLRQQVLALHASSTGFQQQTVLGNAPESVAGLAEVLDRGDT